MTHGPPKRSNEVFCGRIAILFKMHNRRDKCMLLGAISHAFGFAIDHIRDQTICGAKVYAHNHAVVFDQLSLLKVYRKFCHLVLILCFETAKVTP